MQADTPDAGANVFLNGWSPYQAKVAFDVGRVASFYYWGIGRGFGYRDTAQDTIAIVAADPAKARERIGLLARQMQTDGRVYHHFYGDGQGEFTKHCDDPLWFILAVDEYVKETGSFGILDETEASSTPRRAPSGSTCWRSSASPAAMSAATACPSSAAAIGTTPWTTSAAGTEARASGAACSTPPCSTGWTGCCGRAQAAEGADEVRAARDHFRRAVEEHCWDGEWYIRAFGENDRRIGSRENVYGKIFINTQSWAVIAGLPDRGRQIAAMDSAKRLLDGPYGPKICAPAFRKIDPKIGLITRCVWGKKENGAVFNHPTAWLIQAECLLGRGARAWDYYKKLLPDRVDSDVYAAEPYVYSQYITSEEHEGAGRASHSWQTGTAAWMYRVAYDHILGVRPTYAGLLLDPAIPPDWKRYGSSGSSAARATLSTSRIRTASSRGSRPSSWTAG